ncbi:hypothetical protein GQ457_15G015680 [Hibiscus cannabinus]
MDRASHPDILPLWRPETHTFHLPSGEATMTLQDVAYQLGLPVEGPPITETAEDDWFQLVRELVGVDPVDLDDGCVHITWLDRHFTNLLDDASLQLKEQFSRAHILRVIGGILMTYKSHNKVHLMWLHHLRSLMGAEKFSWGSAVLAFLFMELYKATNPSKHVIRGCLTLLQSWTWFRMPFLRPSLNLLTSYIFPLMSRGTRLDVLCALDKLCGGGVASCGSGHAPVSLCSVDSATTNQLGLFTLTYSIGENECQLGVVPFYPDHAYEANGKLHILTPTERQREIYARPLNRPPTHCPRRAPNAAPRRR